MLLIEDNINVADEDRLLRRIPNNPNMLKFDQSTQTVRPSSAAFKDRTDGRELSVTLEKQLLEDGNVHEYAIRNFEGFGLAAIGVKFVRSLKPAQFVIADPTPDDPYHALIVGDKKNRTFKELSKASTLLIKPALEKPTDIS
ncbi:MAG: hypothetical protein JKY67_02795 [Pseudomonadales bacterium]|nr:hypothetical protein [Pseudomonadales bacterium]